MKKAVWLLVTSVVFPLASLAQLTTEQKVADFQTLAGFFAKHYAPYHWKLEQEKFDLLDLHPWLERARATKTDLEYVDLLFEYVGSLNDGHANFSMPSDFRARLGFNVDIYEGKALIETIDRTLLPARDFPFQVGDELVSVDGKPVDVLLDELSKYVASGNRLSTRRFAASLIGSRLQTFVPRTPDLADTALIVIEGQSGDRRSYTLPWVKSGTPILSAGKTPSLRTAAMPKRQASSSPGVTSGLKMRSIFENEMVLNYGALAPVWTLPQGFTIRLGRSSFDYFLSGTFVSAGFRIGFIRIPDFDPFDSDEAFTQFATEVAYMQQNTDGLIVDVMRNPGGQPCYTDNLATTLIPYPHRAVGFELRATADWVESYSAFVDQLKAARQPEWVIQSWEAMLGDLKTAYGENGGRTGALALCGPSLDLQPFQTTSGAVFGYSKPLLVLIDETSSSAAEVFTAQIQDAGRAVIFGIRTSGLGGVTTPWDLTAYTEGFGRITRGLMARPNFVTVEGFPQTRYIENVGVHPDIVEDYMTRDNLVNRGRSFVQRFTEEMVKHIRNSQ
jgi:hypothetical protein